MSKLIQCLLQSAPPSAEEHAQILINQAGLAQEAYHLHQVAADHVRRQRQGLTRNYKTTRQNLMADIAVRVTRELAQVNLENTAHYTAIQEALAQWQPLADDHALECRAVKQALLSCLPAARQTQQLRTLCREYKTHLALDIESQLYNDHYDLYWQYHASRPPAANDYLPVTSPITSTITVPTSAHPLDQFVATHLRSGSLPDSALKKTVVKYEAVRVLEKTLQAPQSAVVQVQHFQQAFPKQKHVLEKNRDSWTTRFLKGVATVFTLGAAVCFGLFHVKGAGVAHNMKKILDVPPPALSFF